MKKTSLLLIVLFCQATYCLAQFEKKTKYINTAATGLDFSVNDGIAVGFEVNGGYMLADNFLATAYLNGNYGDITYNQTQVGIGGRYYTPIGIFVGTNLNYSNYAKLVSDKNDFGLRFDIGYAFFVNKLITLEPGVYYNQSFVNHKRFSKFGIKFGLGFYF